MSMRAFVCVHLPITGVDADMRCCTRARAAGRGGRTDHWRQTKDVAEHLRTAPRGHSCAGITPLRVSGAEHRGTPKRVRADSLQGLRQRVRLCCAGRSCWPFCTSRRASTRPGGPRGYRAAGTHAECETRRDGAGPRSSTGSGSQRRLLRGQQKATAGMIE